MNTRRPIVSANWKANQGDAGDRQRLRDFACAAGASDGVDITVHPPFTALTEIAAAKNVLSLGAQDCSRFGTGAHTGEITATMLRSFGVEYVIVGHSERRADGEDDARIAEKCARAWEAGLNVILCCGETAEERTAGDTERVIRRQLRAAFAERVPEAARIVVAYEPVWAIGSGEAASPEDAQAVCSFARAVLVDCGFGELAAGIRIQYGGSVKPGNVAGFAAREDIDGVLVGGASLEPTTFLLLVRAFADVPVESSRL